MPGYAETGDRPEGRRIIAQHDLQPRKPAQRLYPAVAQPLQPRQLHGYRQHLFLKIQRGRQGELRRIIQRALVHLGLHVLRLCIRFGRGWCDHRCRARADPEAGDAHRRSGPFVEIQHGIIRAEIRDHERPHPEALRAIDQHHRARRLGQRRDLGHRHHHAALVRAVGKENEFQPRRGLDCGGIGGNHILPCWRARQVHHHRRRPPALGQGAHRCVACVVIRVRPQDRIAFAYSGELADQRLQAFRGVAAEADFFRLDAHRLCGTGLHHGLILAHRPAGIDAGLAVQPLHDGLVGFRHLQRHVAPIAMFQLRHWAGHAGVKRTNARPAGFVIRGDHAGGAECPCWRRAGCRCRRSGQHHRVAS